MAAPNSLRSRAVQAKVKMRKKGFGEELRVGRSSVADEQTVSHRTHSNIADCRRTQPTSQVDKPLDAAKTTEHANSADSAGAQEATKLLHLSSFETSRHGARAAQSLCVKSNRFISVNQQDCLRTKTAIKVSIVAAVMMVVGGKRNKSKTRIESSERNKSRR